MSHSMTYRLGSHGLKAVAVLPAVIMAFALPAGPALASCQPNANGVTQSGGSGASGAPSSCPPAYGMPAGDGIGRKTG